MESKRNSGASGAGEVRTHPGFDEEFQKFSRKDPAGAERLLKGLRRFVGTGRGNIQRVRDVPILQRLKISPKLPRVFLARRGGVTYLLGLEKRKVAHASRVLERMERRAEGLGAT